YSLVFLHLSPGICDLESISRSPILPSRGRGRRRGLGGPATAGLADGVEGGIEPGVGGVGAGGVSRTRSLRIGARGPLSRIGRRRLAGVRGGLLLLGGLRRRPGRGFGRATGPLAARV